MLTVYGIETLQRIYEESPLFYLLQQCLPFTVLKQLKITSVGIVFILKLQQCLPFTVLKLFLVVIKILVIIYVSCNSAYRLRY